MILAHLTDRRRREEGSQRGAAFVLAIAVVALLPLVGLPRDPERSSVALELSYLYAADAALIALTLLAIPRLLRAAWRSRDVESGSWLVLFGLVGIAFTVHPSARGIDAVLRLVAAAALVRVVADLDPCRRRIFAGALALTAIVQSTIGALQVATGGPLGLRAFGELAEDMVEYGGVPLARGTMGHEFILAALALVAGTVLAGEGLRSGRPLAWVVPAALAVGASGLVYGRTVAVALGLACASLVRAARSSIPHRWALAALLLGAGVPALAAADGWLGSVSRGTATDRGAMIGQAFAIVADEPLLGVGPGRYLDALRARPELHVTREPQNVHNVPLMVAAEIGAPAGIVVIALLVLLGWNALRAGAPATTLYLAYLPWMILDVLPYATPQGVVLTALWLGFLRAWTRRPSATA